MQIAHVWLSVAPATNAGSTKPILPPPSFVGLGLRGSRGVFVYRLWAPAASGSHRRLRVAAQPTMLVMASLPKCFYGGGLPAPGGGRFIGLRAPSKGVGKSGVVKHVRDRYVIVTARAPGPASSRPPRRPPPRARSPPRGSRARRRATPSRTRRWLARRRGRS